VRARLGEVLDKKGLKVGHYVGDFTVPGIGYMLQEAGAEYVFFDMEHSGNSYETLQRCLRYFEAAGMPAMVRVPSDSYDHIARALDCGADAVVIPMVGTADQARAIVDKMKYTPQGSRGVALALANDRYKMGPVAEALADANDRTKLVCLIETAEGVANVDAIAAVDGVDVLWVGHFDLTCSMGIPAQFDHPDFTAALAKVLKAGQTHNKGLGRMVADVASGVALAEEGWDLIIYHGDVWLYQTALRQGIDGIRSGFAEKAKTGKNTSQGKADKGKADKGKAAKKPKKK
jgi:2-dehydro-3-deoxyglucarate aldolase/4-hydroxy-2-oxoheptanedioate aldolase